jgi:hypothetical protein
MKANMYAAVLQFRAATAVIELISVCEVLIYLIRKIVIRYLNIISEDHV